MLKQRRSSKENSISNICKISLFHVCTNSSLQRRISEVHSNSAFGNYNIILVALISILSKLQGQATLILLK